MAITAPAEKIDSVVSVDEKVHRNYTSRYQVFTDYEDAPLIAAAADGIPEFGDSYQWGSLTDVWAFVKGINTDAGTPCMDPLSPGTKVKRWIVTVAHSSAPTGGSQKRDNPLDDPPVISGSFSPYNRIVSRDRFGNPIVNTANEPPNPRIQSTDAYDSLRLSYNTKNINLRQRADFINTVNSVEGWGLGVRQIKLTKWDYQILWAGKHFQYVKNNFEFLISRKIHPQNSQYVYRGSAGLVGWYTTVKNTGLFYYDWGIEGKESANSDDPPVATPDPLPAAITRVHQFRDGRGTVMSGPQVLTKFGDRAPSTEPVGYLMYEVEEQKNFALIDRMPFPVLPGPFV